MASIDKIELYQWNPLRPKHKGLLGKILPKSRVNNFGDLLGPVIVRELLKKNATRIESSTAKPSQRLFSVGSVLHYARNSDIIWGSGVNGKISQDRYDFTELDVRAVRGPMTRDFLAQLGVKSPAIFGDPGLLVNDLWGRDAFYADPKARKTLIVPNLNDFPTYDPADTRVMNPQSPLEECIQRIASAEFVTGSSLHGIILAESFGIPARLILPRHETLFKYEDYYLGSGRTKFTPASDVNHALELGGELPLNWEADALLDAFPYDLWRVEPEKHGQDARFRTS
ncbi:polysaccharide pyruvyl transferase family protein [Arthrobacter sp. S39]|uniref:polysaccharide pyruvyl transferase family protein n=1 Tax=Arthrobacter sp. S39 TaxID=2509720 RepID=UPI0013EF8067|nr:polysaccharide pyruvyl transferase family protein [Arthrobacter sp. S39]